MGPEQDDPEALDLALDLESPEDLDHSAKCMREPGPFAALLEVVIALTA
jgi:hypothetical protein